MKFELLLLPLSIMATTLLIIITFATSFIGAAIVHPYLVRFAKIKNIVDNPNTRKLQLRPVPVLGGLAIFFGIVAGLLAAHAVIDSSELFVVVSAMMIMTYIGALDDVLDISPIIRLIMQIITVLILIYIGDLSLNNLHGLWGVGEMPEYVYVPLTIVSVVGIINALNLIDGADGLFSIFCISVCAIFGMIFFVAEDYALFALAVACVGSLIPFLLHNAFGIESKMFVGDGGSLQMGVVLSVFVMEVICNPSYGAVAHKSNIALVPFVLSTLSMPVFDTLRVMTARISDLESHISVQPCLYRCLTLWSWVHGTSRRKMAQVRMYNSTWLSAAHCFWTGAYTTPSSFWTTSTLNRCSAPASGRASTAQAAEYSTL